jgi:starch-binding outer membrane protein, SusD/RagB family
MLNSKSMRNKIIVCALILALLSCNKKLDVNPQNSLTPTQIKDENDVIALVFGGYSTLQNANAFGEKYNTFTELLVSDNDINWAGTFSEYEDIFRKAQVASNIYIYDVWANSYHTINIANIVLNKLDLVSEDNKEVVEGEAKFMRGVVYFYLVNLFAQPYSAGNVSAEPGVPLILQPVEGYDPKRDLLPRASVEAIYDQVVSDLQAAAEKLPEDASDFRASKYTALAFLSRVYLSQLKYPEAAAAANEVIESEKYALSEPFDKAFNNSVSSSEDIFAIQQTSQSNSGTSNFGMITFYAGYPLGRGEIQITEDHLQKYDEDDARGQFFNIGESISGSVGSLTSKYRDLYKAIPVIRLAEMYLTRAEANFRSIEPQVGPNTPLDDVNIIRERAGTTPLGAVTADDIVMERFRELAFEGERFFTVKRLMLTVDGHAFDDPKMIFPIPQREIDLKNSLPQNDSY